MMKIKMQPNYHSSYIIRCINYSTSCNCSQITKKLSTTITKYDSTLYIGMDEVLAHYACTFENSNLHFHFQS